MKDYSKIFNGSDYVSIYSKEGRNLLKRYVKKYKNKDFSISQSQFTDIQSAGELPGSLAATENQSLLRSIIEEHEPKPTQESSVKDTPQEKTVTSVRDPSVHEQQQSVHEPSVHEQQQSIREVAVSELAPEDLPPPLVVKATGVTDEEGYEERSCNIC